MQSVTVTWGVTDTQYFHYAFCAVTLREGSARICYKRSLLFRVFHWPQYFFITERLTYLLL
jgi:hypothetical protein